MIWDREHPHPVARLISYVWDEVIATWHPVDLEVWVNPADWEALGRPPDYMGAPVKTSIGVPPGGCRMFDRLSWKYLPRNR